MQLKPDEQEPGLWVNQDWQEGQPGTFAVIIGVSHYSYLRDGAQAAIMPRTPPWVEEVYKLGQLKVSALTALEVFRWLTTAYRVDAAPLACCWLLLSPSHEEQAHTADIVAHPCLPDFDGCDRAIRSWHYAMQCLPEAAKQQSRSFFFFSGHGLELDPNEQILLPCDYLSPPPPPNYNRAISTKNLQNGLFSLEVPYRFFFIDACRTDLPALRAKKLTGTAILNEDEAALFYHKVRIAACLYATSPGLQAFQLPDPKAGLSLFGQALLDGLQGKPDIELQRRSTLWSVTFTKLQGFVEDRVQKFLQAENEMQPQFVMPSGIIREEDVTFLGQNLLLERTVKQFEQQGARIAVGAYGFAILPIGLLLLSLGVSRLSLLIGLTIILVIGLIALIISAILVPTAKVRAAKIEDAIDRAYIIRRQFPADRPRNLQAWTTEEQESWFGNAQVARIWSDRVRLFDCSNQCWLDPDRLFLHRIEHTEDTRRYRIELSISFIQDRAFGVWLELVDLASIAHGCLLPSDTHQPRYVVEFEVIQGNDAEGQITRLTANLSPQNSDVLEEAAALWRRYCSSDVNESVRLFQRGRIQVMLKQFPQIMSESTAKRRANFDRFWTSFLAVLRTRFLEVLIVNVKDFRTSEALEIAVGVSPLAATVSALVLLRANRFDLLQTWVWSMAKRFDHHPDAPVLWAEQVLRQEPDRSQAIAEAVRYLLMGLDRGLPHTSEGLAYAAGLVDLLLTSLNEQSISEERLKLEQLQQRIRQALVYFQPGGLLATYQGFAPGTNPLNLIGPLM